MTGLELKAIMDYCTGTKNYYYSPLMTMKYTDGVKTFARNAQANWLLADICAYKEYVKKANPEEYMFSIHLIVKDNQADLIFKDGDGHISYQHHYRITDCPEGDWLFFYYVDEDVLIWNGEY